MEPLQGNGWSRSAQLTSGDRFAEIVVEVHLEGNNFSCPEGDTQSCSSSKDIEDDDSCDNQAPV